MEKDYIMQRSIVQISPNLKNKTLMWILMQKDSTTKIKDAMLYTSHKHITHEN